MSKFSKIVAACAAMTALAAPAMAIEADVTGFLQVRGMAWDNMDGDDAADDQGRGVDQRFRLFTNAALNENVKAVFGIEVDSIWGRVPYATEGGAGKQVGAMGTDAKSQIEIKHLYLDFNIPGINTNVKAGSQFFNLGRGLIIADDAAGLQARYTPVKDQSILFAWVKPNEGDQYDDSADTDYYHLQYDFKAAGFGLSPYAGYYDAEDNNRAVFLGINADGKIGPVTVGATAIVNDWKAGDNDGNGVALWAKGSYALAPATTVSLEGAWYGDREAGGEFVTLSQGGATGPYNNFAEIVTGGRFDTRSSLVTARTVGSDTGAAAPYYANYAYVKLGAEHKYNPKHSVGAYYIYAKEAERVAGRAAGVPTRITFGHEVDAFYDYAVLPGVTFTVGGGYLFADNDFGAGDDAWKLGTGVTYKF